MRGTGPANTRVAGWGGGGVGGEAAYPWAGGGRIGEESVADWVC